MDNDKRIEHLESVMAEMLKPMKGIPFSVVIKSITDKSVIPVNPKSDVGLIEKITQAASLVHTELLVNPIIRPRPNEVGNDMEPYIMRAFEKVGIKCERPRNAKGHLQGTAYPDVLIWDDSNEPIYVECKIYAATSKTTSMRAFYMSPSMNPKVIYDAKHLLLGFETTSSPTGSDGNMSYTADAFTLVDLHGLLCNVKYEFNASNRDIYLEDLILAQQRF